MSEKIWGRHPVLEALKSRRHKIEKIFIAHGTGRDLDEIRTLAKSYNIHLSTEDRSRLDDLVGSDNHQGVVAVAIESPFAEPADLLQKATEAGEPPFILILDHIEDPQNLGALLRTADAAGCHGVVIPNRRAASLSEGVSKASAGASSHVPVAMVANINQTIEFFKEQGVWIVGAEADAKILYTDHDFKISTALVLGSEGEGISRLTQEKCDFLVKIPLRGEVSSLNVSASGAILMYELLRQRRNKKIIT